MQVEIQDRSKITKIINGALKNAIHSHGDITLDNYSSASKRIYGQLKSLAKSEKRLTFK